MDRERGMDVRGGNSGVKLDTCADDKLPLPGGAWKRVGVKLYQGGIEAPLGIPSAKAPEVPVL